MQEPPHHVDLGSDETLVVNLPESMTPHGLGRAGFGDAECGRHPSGMWTSLRRTLLGLRWSDVDWEGGRLRVQRALARSEDYRWRFVEPKTDRSRRSVVLPASTVDTLRRHRTRQVEERLRTGAAYETALDLVFCNSHGEPLDYRAIVRRHFKPLVQAAGLAPLRPYDLRHTCATLLLASGEHPKVVAERLGHSSTVMTMDVYSHVLPDMQEKAAQRLEELLFG